MATSKYVKPGSLWHVTESEKSLMDRGEGGELIVDSLGSGTFNPTTGKEEKFAIAGAVMIGSAIVGAGAKAYGSYQKGKEEASAAQIKYDQAIEGLENIEKSLTALDENVAHQRSVVEMQGRTAQEDIRREFQQASESQRMQGDKLISQSGLKTGTATQQVQQSKDHFISNMESKTEQVQSTIDSNLASILSMYEEEKGKLSEEKLKLENMKKLAAAEKDKWYLGKNIGKALSGEKGSGSGALAWSALGGAIAPGVGTLAGAAYGAWKGRK